MQGFREQTRGWPQQPVEVAISWLQSKPAGWTVADFGCGDATLAARVAQQVHSFDLVAANDRVVACNMAHVPLGMWLALHIIPSSALQTMRAWMWRCFAWR